MKLPIPGTGLKIDLDVEKQFADLSKKIKSDLDKDFPKAASTAMEKEARQHVAARYPGSKHWDPNKITAEPQDASINVDVPGAVRNYWDVNIYPVDAPSLVYPTEEGYNMGLREWRDIYTLLPDRGWFKPKGHPVIMADIGGELVALYHLRQHVFQGQDPTLLPTDETFCGAICAELMR